MEPLEGHRLSGGSCIEEYLNSQDSSQLHNKVLIHGYIRLEGVKFSVSMGKILL